MLMAQKKGKNMKTIENPALTSIINHRNDIAKKRDKCTKIIRENQSMQEQYDLRISELDTVIYNMKFKENNGN